MSLSVGYLHFAFFSGAIPQWETGSCMGEKQRKKKLEMDLEIIHENLRNNIRNPKWGSNSNYLIDMLTD